MKFPFKIVSFIITVPIMGYNVNIPLIKAKVISKDKFEKKVNDSFYKFKEEDGFTDERRKDI